MTQVRTPQSRTTRSWERIISEINSAPDAATFFRGMLDLQCKIVAAEYGAMWLPGNGTEPNPATAGAAQEPGPATGPDPRLVAMWPEKFAELPQDSALPQLLLQGARSGFERKASHVLRVDAEGTSADPSGAGAHIFVTVLQSGGQVVGVTTVAADCRDASVLQTTQPLRELAAGLTDGFIARQEALQRASDAMLVRRAMAILSTCQDGSGLEGSCLNLVNELARQLKCSSVSVGWVHGKSIRLEAMSDTDHLRRHSDEVGQIELAMAECLDQQQPIVHPVPANAEPLLQHAVVHAHRKLVDGKSNQYVLSIPLRQRDEWIGVLTLERSDEAFDATLIRQMQLIADILAPHLADRRKADRIITTHAWDSIKEGAEYVVGPRHVAWKMLAIGLLVVIVLCLIIKMDFRVSADFVLEAQSKRIVPSPFEGRLDKVFTEPGKKVKQGDLLAVLDTTELSMQLAEAQAKLKLAGLQRDQHISERKQAEAAQDQASIEELTARVRLFEHQIAKSKITAPIDGEVLSGYWLDKVGGMVEQGKEMFQIAPLSDLIAIVRVGEADVDLVKVGQKGALTTRSAPEVKFPFTVSKIVPMAAPVEGHNVFEVWTNFDPIEPSETFTLQKSKDLRPGMEGLAKIRTEPRTLAWIATHRVADLIRLYCWW